MLRLYLCIILLFKVVQCEDNDRDIGAAYRNLSRDLKKDYDRHARPVTYNSIVTKIHVHMHLVSNFDVDEETQSLNVDCYMAMQWDDFHLTWNPASYEDIAAIGISPNEVWMPDIFEIETGGPTTDLQKADFSFIILEYRGVVHWYFASALPGACTFNYSGYPADVAECNIVLQAWSFRGNAIDIDATILDYRIPEEFPKQINSQWELANMTFEKRIWTSKCCGFYPSIWFTVTLTRKTPILQQQLMWLSSVIVVLLTLSMFWIPSDIEQKITVGCVTMVIMTAVLLTVASSVSGRQPVIIMASTIHNVMFAVTVAILLEIIAVNFQHIQEWKPPEFLLNIFSGTVGKVLLITSAQQEKLALDKMKLSEYESGDAMLEQLVTTGNWKTISQALDRVAFILFVLILSAVPKTP